MKTPILFISLFLTLVSAFGQGEVNFNNRVAGAVEARFVNECTLMGIGAGYTAQLFGAPQTTVEANLVGLLPTTTFRTSSAAAQGYVVPVTVTVPGVESGRTATFQVRIFDTGGVLVAKSNMVDVQVGGGLLPPANLVGLQSSIYLCPEPATITLAGVCGLVLISCYRFQSSRTAAKRSPRVLTRSSSSPNSTSITE